jgi:hypothetical protein
VLEGNDYERWALIGRIVEIQLGAAPYHGETVPLGALPRPQRFGAAVQSALRVQVPVEKPTS